jgi:nucleotide-binding universal stress UspA family protein
MSAAAVPTETSLFARVVAGADGSEASLEACRQAATLVEPDGVLEVFTAVNLVEATLTGWSAPRIAEQLEREAGEASRRALRLAGPRARACLVDGPPFPSLMDELVRLDATLVAVGSHGHRRWSEILSGGVAGELLHGAPCSVLVARPPRDVAAFPAHIVVGDDGSTHAATALGAARYLATRFDASVSVVHAADRPVEALVRVSADADLLVVGSRGLHGFRALGSVSERVAHEASCSVLVVRAGSG